jgi:hypothetical protein
MQNCQQWLFAQIAELGTFITLCVANVAIIEENWRSTKRQRHNRFFLQLTDNKTLRKRTSVRFFGAFFRKLISNEKN